jgi:tetratricopeptide (TPR) repeat protein
VRKLIVLAALFAACSFAQTVLALPFFNHSGSPNLDWIGESIAESIHDSLVSEGLLALDRSDRLEGYRRVSLRPGAELTHASVIKVGQALDASKVIYGFYELPSAPPGNDEPLKRSLRITARIIDLKRSSQGPPLMAVGALEDLAKLEVHLGWQALEALKPKGLPSEQEFLAARPPVRIDAVESYIRGLLASAPEQRHRFFTQAARLDEHFSQPCFELGKTYWEKKDYKLVISWLERVNRTDPHYLEARFFLGLSRYHTGDFAGAEQCFREVAASVPLNEVYNNLGAAQGRENKPEAAAASFRKALEGDDGDPDYHFNLGYTLWREGQYKAAAESFEKAVERNPRDAEAAALLSRASNGEGPRPGEPRIEGRQRLKTNYDEAAYRQLQAELGKK